MTQTAGVKLVPDIVAGGGNGQGGTLVDVLLGNLIRDGMTREAAPAKPSA